MLKIIAVFFLAAVSSAAASELTGRFVLEKLPEGYLRMDTETGAMSICAPKSGIWQCTGIKDDMLALLAENTRLKQRLNELEQSRFSLTIPSDRDVDKLLDMFGKMVDRFVEFSQRIESSG